MFDYYREDGELIGMSSSSDFIPGFVIGAFSVACFSGLLIGDVTTPAEYESAVEACVENGGLVKLSTYIETQTVYCKNGARFTQEFDRIEKEAAKREQSKVKKD